MRRTGVDVEMVGCTLVFGLAAFLMLVYDLYVHMI
jgi:hypothetical protein